MRHESHVTADGAIPVRSPGGRLGHPPGGARDAGAGIDVANKEAEEQMVGKWKPIADYVEPSWDNVGDISPLLFWRRRNGAAFGYIRDGELFDAKWVYICDSNKATHFSEVSAPDEKVVELDAFTMRDGERQG